MIPAHAHRLRDFRRILAVLGFLSGDVVEATWHSRKARQGKPARAYVRILGRVGLEAMGDSEEAAVTALEKAFLQRVWRGPEPLPDLDVLWPLYDLGGERAVAAYLAGRVES